MSERRQERLGRVLTLVLFFAGVGIAIATLDLSPDVRGAGVIGWGYSVAYALHRYGSSDRRSC